MSEFLQAVLSLVSVAITAFVIPCIVKHTSEKQRESITKWVRAAVAAAEIIYKDSKKGSEKLRFVKDFLLGKGFRLSESEIEVLIESEVKYLNDGACDID